MLKTKKNLLLTEMLEAIETSNIRLVTLRRTENPTAGTSGSSCQI